MGRRGSLRIGTSGWAYRHWRGPFYPPDLPQDRTLAFYCSRFKTVEVNSTFYRLPSPGAVARWRETAPPGFVYALKASRYITHMKRLKDPDRTLPGFMTAARALGRGLGPILFQLPPGLGLDAARLSGFLAALPEGPRYAFEFRNSSWFDDQVYRLLAGRGAAVCVFDLAGARSPMPVAGEFAYLRLHGPGPAYQGCYAEEELRFWAEQVLAWAGRGLDVYVYFNNDQGGHAPANASRLRAMCSRGLALGDLSV
ncbi:MAG: DUF72 domain-containing protein [Desulfovibrionaceae bacterium]|nr:DUF72 domain-containing protein [Desulfovibrionaceae bacterium]